jgi:hypothetical protein
LANNSRLDHHLYNRRSGRRGVFRIYIVWILWWYGLQSNACRPFMEGTGMMVGRLALLWLNKKVWDRCIQEVWFLIACSRSANTACCISTQPSQLGKLSWLCFIRLSFLSSESGTRRLVRPFSHRRRCDRLPHRCITRTDLPHRYEPRWTRRTSMATFRVYRMDCRIWPDGKCYPSFCNWRHRLEDRNSNFTTIVR